MPWLWLLPLLGAAWFGLNFAIRRGLTAARVLETGEPDGLPWRKVTLPTANGKQLFAAENAAASRIRTYAIATGVTTTTRTLAKVWVTRAAPLEDGGLLFAADPLTKDDKFLALKSTTDQHQ